MSKIGAKISRQKGVKPRPPLPHHPKTNILEDRCQTNSEPLLKTEPIDTTKFKSSVKEVYLGREVAEPENRYELPKHSYARRISAAIILAALIFWFVLDLPNCQSLPRAF